MQSGVSQFAHPCVVTICSVSSTASSTCAMSQQANPSPSVIYNGTSTTNMRGTYYCDGQPLVYISHSQYPTPVYTASHLDTDQLPGLSQRLYYALASSSLYFPASTTDCEKTVRPAIFPATTAYKIDLLAIATHPLSSYNRQLASHMSDIAQSFVDLHVLAKERWAMNSGPASSFTLSRLPWHLASIAHMTDSDLEALLPA